MLVFNLNDPMAAHCQSHLSRLITDATNKHAACPLIGTIRCITISMSHSEAKCKKSAYKCILAPHQLLTSC